MADSKWNDIKEDVKGFGERLTGSGGDKNSDSGDSSEELHDQLEDNDNEALQSDFADEEDVDSSLNRPQFRERIGEEEDAVLVEEETDVVMDDTEAAMPEADADPDMDYDRRAM